MKKPLQSKAAGGGVVDGLSVAQSALGSTMRGATDRATNPTDDGTAAAEEEDEEEDFCAGDRVNARFHGGKRSYPGVIARRDERDGSYVIDYDDGCVEEGVSAKLIKALKMAADSIATEPATLDIGMAYDDDAAAAAAAYP